MHLFNVPNSLSLMRIAIIPFTVLLLLSGRFLAAAATIAFCGILDILDGVAARRLGQVTDLGKLLDPLADKLLSAALFITLSFIGLIPFWFTGCVIAREIVISLAALVIFRKHGFQTVSIYAGKIAFFFLVGTGIIAILYEKFLNPVLAASCITMVCSIVFYFSAYRKFLMRQKIVKTA